MILGRRPYQIQTPESIQSPIAGTYLREIEG